VGIFATPGACRFLKFDKKYTKAIQQVFGRILLCKDLTTATRQARLHRLTCVTLSGEKAHFRGAIESGFVDASKTRIEVMHAINEAETSQAKFQETRKQMQSESNAMQGKITSLMGQVQKLRSTQMQVSRDLQDATMAVNVIDAQMPQTRDQISELQSSIETLNEARSDLEDKIEAQRSEIGTKLKCELTDSELAALNEANDQIAVLSEQAAALEKDLQAAHTKLVQARSHLNDHLLRRQRDLEARRKDVTAGTALGSDSLEGRRLSDLKMDLASTQRKVDKLERQLRANNDTIEKLSNQISDAQDKADDAFKMLDSIRADIATNESALREATDKMSQLMRRRQVLRAKKDETSRKIAELGSVPSTAVAEFKTITSKRELRHKLRDIAGKLGMYSNVNKKALDQFVSFSEERDRLIARRDQLDAGKESIDELIEVLDRRKDEAITRTFTDVQKHFQDVFKEIVHDGHGSLIMKYNDDTAANEVSLFTSCKAACGLFLLPWTLIDYLTNVTLLCFPRSGWASCIRFFV